MHRAARCFDADQRDRGEKPRFSISIATYKCTAMPLKMKPLISIVDDDELVREAISGLLDSLGYRVQAFSSALDFLASADVTDSSCLIADVQMPHMTGIELHERLTGLGHTIPTILITGLPSEAVRDRALANGVFSYLSKPFDVDALIGHVRSALQSQQG